MKTRYAVALSMIAGAALGGAAIQGLHAQAKLKAYTIGEIEVTDTSAQPCYLPAARKAIENAHGRSLRTLNGRVV
jgi:predicted RNA polymerase sigma factor